VEAGFPLTKARIGSGAVGWRSRVRSRYRFRRWSRDWTPAPGTVPVAGPRTRSRVPGDLPAGGAAARRVRAAPAGWAIVAGSAPIRGS